MREIRSRGTINAINEQEKGLSFSRDAITMYLCSVTVQWKAVPPFCVLSGFILPTLFSISLNNIVIGMNIDHSGRLAVNFTLLFMSPAAFVGRRVSQSYQANHLAALWSVPSDEVYEHFYETPVNPICFVQRCQSSLQLYDSLFYLPLLCLMFLR